MATWLERWEPEDQKFWEEGGRRRAWTTLAVTILALVPSFATWFVMSAVSVRLPAIGFKFDTMQLFWLAALPGLSGGALRTLHTFFIPIFGTRHTITVATFLKVLPMVWLGLAVQDPATPYLHFLIISFLCGFGGGDFSSFMPSTSLFFPKRLQGTAMGLQAGVGNLGVSITQLVTPWIIGFPLLSAFGGSQVLKKLDAATGKVVEKTVWLQNAALWYVVWLLVAGVVCWLMLKSIRIKRRSFVGMLKDMTNNKHGWFMTLTYIMTFGSFAGLSAAFPLMIKSIYGTIPGVDPALAPDPLKYAFLGPLVGSVVRFVGGPLADRWGGSIFTQISGLGLTLGSCALIFGGLLTPTSLDVFPTFVWTMLWMFLMAGIGNFATFRQYPIVYAYSPRMGAQILGWTGAWAAYGPFVFSSLIGGAITRFGSAIPFFAGAAVFYVVGSVINWWYYTRPGAERGDWGAGKTWWDRLPAAERDALVKTHA